MTNAHVVDGADEVLVTLTDKREFKARIVGADKRTDVAVVKIQATGLPAVRVGDVGRLKVGEWVMAIGSPFGLENSVTAGIVSAKQRDTGEYLPFIQTDVAINPGNSGGPLINMRGEVVGINSQIYSRSGGFMGISFAIPMDEAMRVSEQLRSNGRVSRGRIGVQIAPVTKEVAESIGLEKAQGVLVRGVEEGSPAEKAGIEAGDIITRFEGKVIDKPADLPRAVGNTKPGSRAAITIFRRGKSQELNVMVAEIEADKPIAAAPDKKAQTAAVQHLGLSVSDLTEAVKKEFRVRGGVRVDAAVDAAARAGIREGDLVLAIANTEQALTHRSFSADHYERLEFLGDSVLNLAVSHMLYVQLADMPEGDLSRVRANLVKQDTLHQLAKTLDVSEVMRLGEGEMRSGGQGRPSILADMVEAIIGAVYLDGGYPAAQALVERLFAKVDIKPDMQAVGKDPKTELQEWLQGRKLALPKYTVVGTSGAAHRQQFEVSCEVTELRQTQQGSGASRRAAEQAAAAAMLLTLKSESAA
eukprot:gene830-812_t